MNITLIAAGTRMPAWVRSGFETFSKRLPRECALVLKEVPIEKRVKNSNVPRLVSREGERMLGAVPKGARLVALDERGKAFTTLDLGRQLEQWLAGGRDVAIMIGGPDGLSPACSSRAELEWSLSRLTLPHCMVRIIVAEQLYRAWSVIHGHPYHRD